MTPCVQSDERQETVLRSHESSRPDLLAVEYHGQSVQCRLQAGAANLLSGTWDSEVRISGHLVPAVREWENVCWETNDEAAYAELQLELADGLRIQRQIFLARRDRFALLADVLTAPTDLDGQYEMRLSVPDQIRLQGDEQGNEAVIFQNARAVARAMPLSLPEWRREGNGFLQLTDGMHLIQPVRGAGTVCRWANSNG
jgi:hypothetical protein